VSKNAINLKLLATMRIHLVVNVQPVGREKRKEPKLTEIDILEELEVEKILNKRMMFKKVVTGFERRMNTEIKRQKAI